MTPTPVPMSSHDQRGHVANHFDCLDLMNAMVPLMMPSVSCDANASVNGVRWPKSNVSTSFNPLDLMNAVVSLMIPLASYDTAAGTSGVMGPKSNSYYGCTTCQLHGQNRTKKIQFLLVYTAIIYSKTSNYSR